MPAPKLPPKADTAPPSVTEAKEGAPPPPPPKRPAKKRPAKKTTRARTSEKVAAQKTAELVALVGTTMAGFGMATGQPLTAYDGTTLILRADEVGEAVGKLAVKHPAVGAVVDRLVAAGESAGLVATVLGVAGPIVINHLPSASPTLDMVQAQLEHADMPSELSAAARQARHERAVAVTEDPPVEPSDSEEGPWPDATET